MPRITSGRGATGVTGGSRARRPRNLRAWAPLDDRAGPRFGKTKRLAPDPAAPEHFATASLQERSV